VSDCASGRECAAPGAVADGPLCPECLHRAAVDVAELPTDYADLGRELTPDERGLRRRVGGDDERPIPLALHVEALQRSIFWALTVWEPPVREAAGLSPERTRGVRDGWAVEAAAKVIAPRLPILAALGPTWGYADGLDAGPVERDGVDAVVTLRTLHRRARAVCGLTCRDIDLPGHCPGCGAAALLRRDGTETVRCGVCDDRRTYDDYRRYVGLMLIDYMGAQ
jgi:hypothetical protein